MYDTLETVVQRRRGRRKKRMGARLWLFMRENAPTAAGRAAAMAAFFFLSVSECFRVPSPFAICALTAFVAARRELLFPALGIGASLALRALWGVPLDVWQYAGCALILLSSLKPPKSAGICAAYAAVALSLRLFAGVISPVTQQEFILRAVSVLVGAGCAPAFCHVLRLGAGRAQRVGVDDILCAVLLCAVLLCGAGRVAAGPVNVGFVLAGAGILACACVGGCMAAVCAGIICGISLALCGHADSYAVCYAFIGVLCGLFYGRKRGVLCVIYLLGSAFTSYAVRFSLDLPFLYAAAASCAVFLALPNRYLGAAYAMARRLSPDAVDMESAYAQFTRAQWAANIRKLSQLLPEVRVPEPAPQERMEDIVQKLCAGCDGMTACWHERPDRTRAMLESYFLPPEGEDDGGASPASHDFTGCVRQDKWPELLREDKRSRQQLAQRCAYATREREAARTHLAAISQAMARFSHEGGMCGKGADTLAGEAAYLLRRMRVAGRVLYALRVEGHISIALRCEPQLTGRKQLERYCQELSRLLCAPLHIVMRQKDMALIEEMPPLMAESCHLTAASGDGGGENGDAALLRSGLGGMEITMLSDGMGHGAQAHTESEKTLELLSLCMDAGYTVNAALAAINCVMLSSTDGEQYATVDLCVTDLWRGSAVINKLGACPSILITGGSLRMLSGSAPPLGILPQARPCSHSVSVADGDMLILFTDGLSDACGGLHALEQQVELVLRSQKSPSPEAMADALMSAALRRSGGVPKDDVTVLCTRYARSRRTAAREQ